MLGWGILGPLGAGTTVLEAAMVVNRIRKYTRLLERKLHDHCQRDSWERWQNGRGFASDPSRTGGWYGSLSLSHRIVMETILSRSPPLNILIIPNDERSDIAPSLSALKSHWTLVCPVAAEVVETARRFEPDVVFVDEQVSGLLGFPFQLAGSTSGRNPVFVVMSRTRESTRALPPGYAHCLPLPATAVELEQLLWQIRRTAISRPPDRPGRPDAGMIG
jgi:hypothetical protein